MAIGNGQQARAGDFINASERDATPANDAGKVPKLESDGKLDEAHTRDVVVRIYTSGDTWNKPAGLKYVVVELVGGGGGGEANGLATAAGSAGGTSSFGAHLSATGGDGGDGYGYTNSPGTGTGGDINAQGGCPEPCPQSSSVDLGTKGGDSFFAGGGKLQNDTAGNNGQLGSGGAGANGYSLGSSSNRNGQGGFAGGYSRKTIQEDDLGATETITVGSGGTGGSAATNGYDGGDGGDGVVIVTEYYI